jgi:putative membrane protein
MNMLLSKFKQTITDYKEVRKFFIIFYIVGFLGFIFDFTYPLFVKLIPYAILISIFMLYVFHQNKKDLKLLIVFFIIFLLGFLVEMIGVNTGKIFGNYYYGKGLGIKIFETPIMIGVNWAFLVYLSTSVTQKYKLNDFSGAFVSSLIMLLYDFIIENIAPKTDMWYWQNDVVPFQNYLAWFFIALFFNCLVKLLKLNTENKIAPVILICQILFFGVLLIFLLLKK